MNAIGRRVYGLGAVVLGIVVGAFGAFSTDWLPVPPHMPGYHLLAYLAAALLIPAGLAINAPRVGPAAAAVLAVFFALLTLALQLPPALAKPMVWVGWQAVAESAVMAIGGVLAWAQGAGMGEPRAATALRLARWGFGLCLLVFGVSHFVYAKFTATLVPAWLPPSRLFWTYATGVAQIAAGLAVLSGIQARLAAILLTVMYAVFGLLVHLPSVIAAPMSRDNWTENAINLILLGAAWTLADALRTAARR